MAIKRPRSQVMKPITPPSIAEQLRAAIAASGRSARELAKAADVSNSLVTRFMNEPGKTINVDTAESLAKALGMHLLLKK